MSRKGEGEKREKGKDLNLSEKQKVGGEGGGILFQV